MTKLGLCAKNAAQANGPNWPSRRPSWLQSGSPDPRHARGPWQQPTITLKGLARLSSVGQLLAAPALCEKHGGQPDQSSLRLSRSGEVGVGRRAASLQTMRNHEVCARGPAQS